jgi:Ferredoxin-like domain in Api92-like protein
VANWCDSHLIIMVTSESMNDPEAYATSRAELERFKKALDEIGKGLMETFLPMPEKYNDTVRDRANSVTAEDGKTWYDWQVENWGVKWGDSYLKVLDKANKQLELMFRTAWGLPVAGLAAISKLFPTLEFLDDWEEETPSKGYLLARDGEVAWSVARVPALRVEAIEGTAGD